MPLSFYKTDVHITRNGKCILEGTQAPSGLCTFELHPPNTAPDPQVAPPFTRVTNAGKMPQSATNIILAHKKMTKVYNIFMAPPPPPPKPALGVAPLMTVSLPRNLA